MRVAAHDLAGDRAVDIGEVERTLLRGELRVQDHLEEQVAQLLGKVGGRSVLDGIERLVGLLEQVRSQREVGLPSVPGASVGCTQARADGRHAVRAAEVGDRVERGNEPGRCGQSGVVKIGQPPAGSLGQALQLVRGGVERPEDVARARTGVPSGQHRSRRCDRVGKQDQGQ